MPRYKVLSTKNLSPSLIEQAKQHDIEIKEQEFIMIRPIRSEEKYQEIIKWAEAGILDIVFTSSNAADILSQYLSRENRLLNTNWKIYCISGKTKEQLQHHFHSGDIVATAENGKDLATKIVEHGVKEVLFFCGNKRRDELPDLLKQHHIAVHEVVIYETVDTPSVIANDIDAVLFFSPSAVNSFFSSNQLKEGAVCFAIGSTTANTIANYTCTNIITSTAPSQEMMLTAVLNYFTNKVNK